MTELNVVPPITDPLGRHWDQPAAEDILLHEKHALMTPGTFKQLHEYSTTLPTGTYSGKMWRRRIPFRGEPARWFLCWYGEIVGTEIMIYNREILFA
jgi:hypothetical protein